MGSEATKLLEAALKLPPEVRAAMAGSLLDSLGMTGDAVSYKHLRPHETVIEFLYPPSL